MDRMMRSRTIRDEQGRITASVAMFRCGGSFLVQAWDAASDRFATLDEFDHDGTNADRIAARTMAYALYRTVTL